MKVLLAIPIYNEERYVDAVLTKAKQYISDILVIDDGSTDGTSNVLTRHKDLSVLTHTCNIGYGHSLIDAFHYGKLHDYDWIITMDCDDQHEPQCIPAFLTEIRKRTFDIISGSRYLQTSPDQINKVPPERLAINRGITYLLKEYLDLNLTDAFCGFKAYRLASLSRLSLTVPGYGLPLQIWAQAAKQGLIIKEIAVPLIYHDPSRQFQGKLEDSDHRFAYYTDIMFQEIKRPLNIRTA